MAEVAKVNPDAVHLKKMDKRLKHWGEKLEELSQTTLSFGIDEKAEVKKRIVDLRAKLEHAHARLEALRSAGKDKWEGFKTDLEVAVRDLETLFSSDQEK